MKPSIQRRKRQAEARGPRRKRVKVETIAPGPSEESPGTRTIARPSIGPKGSSLFPRRLAAHSPRISHVHPRQSLQPLASTIPPLQGLPSVEPAIPAAPPKKRVPLVARVALAAAVAAVGYAVHAAGHRAHRSVVPVVVSGTARLRETPSGAHERWGKASLTLTLDPSLDALDPAAKEAVRSAFGAWVATGIALPRLTFESRTDSRGAAEDGVNVVLYGPITRPGHEHDLALTIGYEDAATGEILEADTIFNSAYRFAALPGPSPERPEDDASPGCGNRYDLENLATHEAGHFFGLGEDTEDTRATMYFRSAPCQTHKRVLTDPDRAIMATLYAEPVSSAAQGGCGAAAAPDGTPKKTTDPGSMQASAQAMGRSTAALSTGTILWLDGTYGAGCSARSGAWSVRVSGAAAMDSPALSVVKNNTACVLTLTNIVADQTYTGVPSIAMTTAYGAASPFAPSGGPSFYANAVLSSSSFASSFTVTVLYSDNPSLLTGALTTAYVSVSTTSSTTGGSAPSYTLDLATGAFAPTVNNATATVQSVSGTANLVQGATAGGGYYVDQGALPPSPTFAQLDTAYSGATTTAISSTPVLVPASAFGLPGVSLGSAVVRTIVIQHNVSGVHSYQTFALAFGCAGTCGNCPTGESSKADSTGMAAATVCCAAAATTLNCGGTCVNTLVDSSNCGGCGTVCPAANPACSAGSCGVRCPTGSSLCSGICVETSIDNANCGSCGYACPTPSYCSAGQCGLLCNGNSTPVTSSFAGGTYEVIDYPGFVLENPGGGGAGTGLDQWAYTGTNQQWTITNVGNGAYKILAANGLALTAQGFENQVTVQTYTGSNQQLFAFVPNGSSWCIVNLYYCSAVDDKNNGGPGQIVAQYPFGGTGVNHNQTWTVALASGITAPVADGVYELANSGYALDDPGGGGAGTVPDEALYQGTNQQWTVALVSGVQYKITAANGQALTMSATPNTTIAGLSSYTGSSYQLWVFWPTGAGSYYVLNVGARLALDAAGAGAEVQPTQSTWTKGSTSQYWTLPPASGMIAYYPFDESSGTSAHDSSGNSQTATLNGGAAFTAGLDGNAVTLNGSTGYVALPAGIVNGLSAFSISLWTNLSAAPQGSRLFDFGTGSTVYMCLEPSAGGVQNRFAISTNGNAGEQQFGTAVLTLNSWQHLVVTISGTTGTLYVNGASAVQNTSLTLNPASLGSTTQNWLGRSQYVADPYPTGQIDNFRIYNRALSSAEVQQLFAAK